MVRSGYKVIFAAMILSLVVSCEKEQHPSVLNSIPEPPVEQPERRFVAAEQSGHRIIIVNTKTKEIEWEWSAADAGISAAHQKWFEVPDEVKPVYNGDYFIVTASGGGVGLIRKTDKKLVFYACPGGNPHSAEILPDGNIAVASSTGNSLKLYEVSSPFSPTTVPVDTEFLTSGHNVVWDREGEVLWASADNVLNCYTYTNIDGQPALAFKESIALPEGENSAHELFPVYGENRLWLSTAKSVFRFDVATKIFEKISARTSVANIKSVSSGPADYPVMILRPTESWWSYSLIDSNGSTVYVGPNTFRIYKGRWLLDNTFSYPEVHELTEYE